MKTSTILLLTILTPLTSAWTLRWGPKNAQGTPKYLRSGNKDLSLCQDFRREYANRPAKDPAPGYLLWLPNENNMVGCCLHVYGSANGVNHNCRRLEGRERHVNEFCDGKNHLIKLGAGEGIGSYRVLGCRRRK